MAIQRLTTKEALVASLVELAGQKPFDKITVEEIARNCGVSKRMFYNHFADKYELAVMSSPIRFAERSSLLPGRGRITNSSCSASGSMPNMPSTI